MIHKALLLLTGVLLPVSILTPLTNLQSVLTDRFSIRPATGQQWLPPIPPGSWRGRYPARSRQTTITCHYYVATEPEVVQRGIGLQPEVFNK